MVVDDDVAASDWEQDLYALGVPDGVTVEFLDTAHASSRLGQLRDDEIRTFLLCRDVGTMVRLAETGGLSGTTVNLGGIHHGPGRTQVLSYLYLDKDDAERLQQLESLGVDVSAQDLPGSRAVDLAHLLP